MDLDALEVTREGESTRLTLQEAQLLRYLADASRTVPRSELLVKVWGYAPQVASRAVDATVSRLRAKIETDPTKPRSLLSVRGKGYRLQTIPRAAAATTLLGRETERAQLRFLVDQHPIVQIVGRGGIGKTSLALDLARERNFRFVDFRTARTIPLALATLADSLRLELARESGEDAIQHIGEALARDGRPVVLDNVEQFGAAFRPIVTAFAEAGLTVLLTSRTPLSDSWACIEVGPLDMEASRALLSRSGRRVRADWQGETTALDRIAELVDRLPLALELFGSQLPMVSASDLETRLKDVLAVGDGRERRHANLAESIRWSWSLLEPRTRQAALKWSCFAGPLDLAALEHTAPGLPALTILNELTRAGWIDTSIPRFWTAVRAFLTAELDRSDGRRDADIAHASWLLTHLTAPDDEDGAGLRERQQQVELWRADIRVAMGHEACSPSDRARLGLILLEQSRRLDAREAARIVGEVVALADASTDPVLKIEARLARLEQSKRARDHAREDERLAELAALLEPHASPELWARFRSAEGHNARVNGRIDEALVAYRASREHATEAGMRVFLAGLDHDEGAALRRLGRLEEARLLLMRSAAASRALDAPYIESLASQALAAIERARLNLDTAQTLARRAVDSARRADDPYALGGALTNLANVLGTSELPDASIAAYREAVDVLRRGGFHTPLSVALGNLAIMVEHQGDPLEAELLLIDALMVAERAGAPYAAAVWRMNLAELAHIQGRVAEARTGYETVIPQLEAQKAHPQLELVYVYAGIAAAQQSQHALADRYLAMGSALEHGGDLVKAIWMLANGIVATLRGEWIDDPLEGHAKSLEWAAETPNIGTTWRLWKQVIEARDGASRD